MDSVLGLFVWLLAAILLVVVLLSSNSIDVGMAGTLTFIFVTGIMFGLFLILDSTVGHKLQENRAAGWTYLGLAVLIGATTSAAVVLGFRYMRGNMPVHLGASLVLDGNIPIPPELI